MPILKLHRPSESMKVWNRGDASQSTRASALSPRFRDRFVRRWKVTQRPIDNDERLKKNRRIIDQYIRRMSPITGKELYLNSDGLAFFLFQKFIVVIEVPADQVGVCYIYTMVCHLSPEDNQSEVLKMAMELNYMQLATKGATLGLDREEVNLCYCRPISGLTFSDLEVALQDFLMTAVLVNEQLESAKGKMNSA